MDYLKVKVKLVSICIFSYAHIFSKKLMAEGLRKAFGRWPREESEGKKKSTHLIYHTYTPLAFESVDEMAVVDIINGT